MQEGLGEESVEYSELELVHCQESVVIVALSSPS